MDKSAGWVQIHCDTNCQLVDCGRFAMVTTTSGEGFPPDYLLQHPPSLLTARRWVCTSQLFWGTVCDDCWLFWRVYLSSSCQFLMTSLGRFPHWLVRRLGITKSWPNLGSRDSWMHQQQLRWDRRHCPARQTIKITLWSVELSYFMARMW